jgi:hypothetical protein
VVSLMRDACHFVHMSTMSTTAAASSVAGSVWTDTVRQLRHCHETLMRVHECPFLFVTAQGVGATCFESCMHMFVQLRAANMLQEHKYNVLELREHYDTLQERREQCIRVCCCNVQ